MTAGHAVEIVLGLPPASEKVPAGMRAENLSIKNWSAATTLSSAVTERPPVFWCHFLESWRQDGENSEKMAKKRAKMGEIWPKKKSAGRRSIIELSSVLEEMGEKWPKKSGGSLTQKLRGAGT